MTAQAAFAYSPEIYRETTRSTSIVYGPCNRRLLPASATPGVFAPKPARAWTTNERIPERRLQRDPHVHAARQLYAAGICGSYRRTQTHQPQVEHPARYIGFTVRYRVKSADGKAQAEWKEQQTPEPAATLYGLQSGAAYEYRAASSCIAGQPVYSPVFTIAFPL